MTNKATLKVESRDGRGKGAARRLRRAGAIPGNVYGRDTEPVAVADLGRSGGHAHLGQRRQRHDHHQWHHQEEQDDKTIEAEDVEPSALGRA
ncbi:MAG: hypothetical protein P8049_13020 [Gemmatimonadota bacterium]